MELTLVELNVVCDALNKLQNNIADNLWKLENDAEISPTDAFDVMQGLIKAHKEVTAVFIKFVHQRDLLNSKTHDSQTATDRYAFKLTGETSSIGVPCSIHHPGQLPIHVWRDTKNKGI